MDQPAETGLQETALDCTGRGKQGLFRAHTSKALLWQVPGPWLGLYAVPSSCSREGALQCQATRG